MQDKIRETVAKIDEKSIAVFHKADIVGNELQTSCLALINIAGPVASWLAAKN
jgi:hypothetical protein